MDRASFRLPLRPGVFSEYTLSPVYGRGKVSLTIGIAAAFPQGETGTVQKLETVQEAEELLPDGVLLDAVTLLLRQGARAVYLGCIGAQTASVSAADCRRTLGLLWEEGVQLLIFGQETSPCLTALRESLEEKEGQEGDRIAFLGADRPEQAAHLASALLSPRAVICCPGGKLGSRSSPLFSAAALCGAVAGLEEAVCHTSGLELPGLEGLSLGLTEEQVEALLAAGVTPLEEWGESAVCIKAVTAAAPQGSPFSSLSAVLTVDYVNRELRSRLRDMLKGAGNRRLTLDGISSQITVFLSQCCDQEILYSFEAPKVYSDPQDGETCIAEVAFRIARAIDRICIRAVIQI